MLIGIIGENCSGKSTLAVELAGRIGAEIISGKDYLRMAKSESEAKRLFVNKLDSAVHGDNLIYVISDSEQLALLPEGAVTIYAKAELSAIKERFKTRMRGALPPPVEMMLERRHGMFDSGEYDYVYLSDTVSPSEFCDSLALS